MNDAKHKNLRNDVVRHVDNLGALQQKLYHRLVEAFRAGEEELELPSPRTLEAYKLYAQTVCAMARLDALLAEANTDVRTVQQDRMDLREVVRAEIRRMPRAELDACLALRPEAS